MGTLLRGFPLTLSFRLRSGSFFIFIESFRTVRGDLILSGKDQLIDVLLLAGLGLEEGESPPVDCSEGSVGRTRLVSKWPQSL